MRLRSHLTLLVAGAVVPVLLVAIVAGILLVRHERARIERDAVGRARATMSAIDAELRGALSTLEGLASSRHLVAGDLRAFHDEARRVLASQDDWVTVTLVSPAKIELLDARGPFGKSRPATAEPESLERVIRTARTTIGNVASSPGTPAPAVRIRVPVVHGGSLRYVLSAALEPHFFTDLLHDQQLPGDWVIALADRNKRFVTRLPPRPPGEPVSQSFREAIERSPEGFFPGHTLEGVSTYTPYVTSPLTGWVLGIAMPRTEVDAGAGRMAMTMAAGVAIALAVALWLAWLMVRRIVTPMAALASAADAIGRGEHSAVPIDADVREVQDVARALDSAATAVHAREAELVRSRSQFESLVAVARTLNTLDLDAVLSTIVESACSLLDAEVATLFRLEAGSGTMILVAGGGARGLTINRNTRMPRGMGLVGLAVEHRTAVVSDNILTDERIVYEPAMRARVEVGRHRAAVAVPLTIQGRISGALFVGAEPGRVFSATEIRLVTTFADQAAVAIENAELYHDVEQSSRAKDEFLAMLGHELRNPLGAIASAASLLDRAGASREPTERARLVINRQVQHLSRLVDDLLDVSRLATGKTVLVRRPFDLGELVRSVVHVWRSSGRFDRHRVVVDVSPVWMDGDEARMEQVLGNLVGNAIKYTPPDGTVTIRVTADGPSAVITVTDTGVGMPPELVEKVFDLFVQGERTLDRAQGGLGIGLTMVKRLVELHGGMVDASSDGLGAGATFRVRVPAVAPPSHVPATTTAPAVSTPARRRILIVEDNDDGREMLRVQLTLAGHEVHEAADGPTGVEQATTLRPDVALIDVGLPGLDGYEVARRIRAAHGGKAIFLVALTGYGQAEDRRLAHDAGFDAHLTKPVLPERIADVLLTARPRSAAATAGA